MVIDCKKLDSCLKAPLSSLWLVTGEEELSMIESVDRIRRAAHTFGYTEREILNASATWNWSLLAESCQSMSLFAQSKVIELRLASASVGKRGADILSSLEPPPEGVILIVSVPSDWSVRKLAWFKKLSERSTVVNCPPITLNELPQWFRQRLRSQNQTIDDEALAIFTERCEGNLLAASQEVLKLAYRYPAGTQITKELVADSVSDVSHFDPESLMTAMMTGDGGRAVRILEGLKAEGIAPPAFLWMLTDCIRLALKVHTAVTEGQRVERAIEQARIFGERKQCVASLVRRMNTQQLMNAHSLCADIDRLSKGLSVDDRDSDVWLELMGLAAFLSKKPS